MGLNYIILSLDHCVRCVWATGQFIAGQSLMNCLAVTWTKYVRITNLSTQSKLEWFRFFTFHFGLNRIFETRTGHFSWMSNHLCQFLSGIELTVKIILIKKNSTVERQNLNGRYPNYTEIRMQGSSDIRRKGCMTGVQNLNYPKQDASLDRFIKNIYIHMYNML